MSRRADILAAAQTRLRAAFPSGVVLVGEDPSMGPDDADVVIGIAPGTDDPSDELHRYARVLSFGVFLTARADSWLEFERNEVAACMDAIEDGPATPSGSRGTLDGTCAQLLRDNVASYVRVEGTRTFGVEIGYSATFAESRA